jgi:uncharacterized protein (DUF1499 family)
MNPRSPSRGKLDAVGAFAVALFVVGPALAWLRVVPALMGFALFAVGGLAAIVVTLIALVSLARGRGMGPARAAALLAAIVFVVAASAGAGAPRINDFTTDLDDPPAYRQAALDPANAGRDLAYPPAFAADQRACCGDLRPARLAIAPDAAFARARSTSEAMPGWTIVLADPASGTIEAVATSRLFGFRDDVVIRVRSDGDGSRVDVRSKSRDGKGDMGANADRIRAFVSALEASATAG